MTAIVELLQEMGPQLPVPHSSGVESSRHSRMRELRIQSHGDPLRVFYAFDPSRSAILLILFIVIHAVGNLHVFKGPDDFNGYGYFYVRLYWTGFGLPANIVEEYILLSVLLHVIVGLKRTWDMKLKMVGALGSAARRRTRHASP